MLQPSFFNSVFVFPILNILAGYHYVLSLAHIPGTLGFSIILLTVTIRLLLHPFFKQQMDTAGKMQSIKPQLDAISKKFKGDSKKIQEEQMRLYQEAGINPASGCLFMVIQIPIFIALYQTLQYFLVADTSKILIAVNKALYLPVLHFKTLDPSFFGVNLAQTPQKLGIVFLVAVPVITGLLQYFQTQTTMAMNPQPLPTETNTKDGKDKKEPGIGDEFQKAMNTQMKYIFPVMIGWFSLRMPVGLALYWNIFSVFSIIQFQLHKKDSQTKTVKLSGKN
jgi:YidC/Oxa1 family membrane protein insertase